MRHLSTLNQVRSQEFLSGGLAPLQGVRNLQIPPKYKEIVRFSIVLSRGGGGALLATGLLLMAIIIGYADHNKWRMTHNLYRNTNIQCCACMSIMPLQMV